MVSMVSTEVYLELSQTSKVELFRENTKKA